MCSQQEFNVLDQLSVDSHCLRPQTRTQTYISSNPYMFTAGIQCVGSAFSGLSLSQISDQNANIHQFQFLCVHSRNSMCWISFQWTLTVSDLRPKHKNKSVPIPICSQQDFSVLNQLSVDSHCLRPQTRTQTYISSNPYVFTAGIQCVGSAFSGLSLSQISDHNANINQFQSLCVHSRNSMCWISFQWTLTVSDLRPECKHTSFPIPMHSQQEFSVLDQLSGLGCTEEWMYCDIFFHTAETWEILGVLHVDLARAVCGTVMGR